MILSRQQLEHVVGLAITAPSVLNTQPWRFTAHADVIDVFAVPALEVPVVDPAARETHISCGAAVFNLRLAIAALGRTPVVRLLPNPENRLHVAQVRISGPGALQPHERPLADAIPRRHTSREPFTDDPVPDMVRNALSAAADMEGARLDIIPAWRREVVVKAVHEADLVQRQNQRVSEEVDRWTLHRDESDSGIPAPALGPRASSSDATVRDFAFGRPVLGRETAEFEKEALLAVLLTLGDDQAAWLRAGLALERVLLTATAHGVSAGLLTSPLEVPSLRNLLVDAVATRGHPQVLLRFGYGPEPAHTPRRDISAVLQPAR